MSQWRTVLCAVDFSESSRRALEEAAALARRLQAILTVVHVEPGMSGPAVPFAPPPRPEHRDPDAAAKLESWAKGAEAAVGQPVETVLLTGRPADEIVRAAENGGYDAVVLGTNGRSGFARAVLGSVAEHVLRRAKGAEAAVGQPVETVLLTGRPADEIVRAAENGGYDAVVLGTHGRSGVARAVLGSVAEHVLRRAKVPVVVVRAG